MKLAIMQPYFFPYLGYFSLIDSVDTFVVYDDVNFIRRGWVNRNNFLGKQGVYRYTLPVKKASQNEKISNLSISEFQSQKKRFLTSMEHSYKKAPYYERVSALLNLIYSTNDDNLSNFLTRSLQHIIDYLGISATLLRSSELHIAKNTISQARIIEMCKELQASTYINAQGGAELYDSTSFSSENINLEFINFEGSEYKQHTENSFVSNLSVIDGMMFNSPSELLSIIKRYSLNHG